MHSRGVRAHYVTTALLAPLLIRTGDALVVTVSADPGPPSERRSNVAYGAAKAADDLLAQAYDADLHDRGVRSLAIHPGLVRTEGVLQFAADLDLGRSTAPEAVGRVVAALAGDPDRVRWAGHVATVTELAAAYGIDLG